MSEKKVVVVVGATGFQGGGLCRAILKDPTSPFSVRAITRDSESSGALALAEAGAEVFEADLEDEEAVVEAFRGAYGAYCVTVSRAGNSVVRERAQARAMARAAQVNGLKHVVWSTLEDTREWLPVSDERMPVLQGNYNVPGYDAKGGIDHFFTELGLPVTFLRSCFYWDSLYAFKLGPSPGKEGEFELSLPMGGSRLAGICAEDIGRCAYGIFKAGAIGKTIGIMGEALTGEEMAQKLSDGLGVTVKYRPVSPEQFRHFGFPSAVEVGNMFQVLADFEKEHLANRSQEVAREFNPQLRSFDQWLQEYRQKLHYRVSGRDLMQHSIRSNLPAQQFYSYVSEPTEGVTRVMQELAGHWKHMAKLEEEGILFAAGPLADGNSDDDFDGRGLVIIRAGSAEEAREIADADPLHISGARTYTLTPWIRNRGVETLDLNFATGQVKFL